MTKRKHWPTVIGCCLAVLALAGSPQASGATPSTPPHASKAATTSAPAKSHKAKSQSAARARSPQQTPVAAEKETAYQTALRRCVTGQAQQRDPCLDDAIARYGHS